MASITIAGNCYVVTSEIPMADLELIRKHRPNALKIVDEETKEELFAVGLGGNSLSDYGVSFGGVSNDEMKLAAICGKIAERSPLKATAATVFNAATLGGAKALGRDDLGRLARGAKADFIVVDTNNSQMCPLRDPIKALVYSGMSSDFAKIFVDGELLVENGRLLKEKDEGALRRDLQQSAEAMYARVKEKHWDGKSHAELAPMSFPVVDSDSF